MQRRHPLAEARRLRSPQAVKLPAGPGGGGEAGGAVWGSEGLIVSVSCARRSQAEAGGRPTATQNSSRRSKPSASSSLELGEADAGSQWSAREETDGVGGHRHGGARGGELKRLLQAPLREDGGSSNEKVSAI